jgi:glycosyltransferase involved in cell wall biosynthesis
LKGAAAAARAARFDLVHAHCAFPAGLAAWAVARRYRVPLVVTEHWAPYDQLMQSSRLSAFSIRWVVRSAEAVAAVSSALRAEMVHWTGRETIQVVPPAVDTDLFHPGPSHARGTDVRLLFVAHLTQSRKRLEDVLTALAIVARDPGRSWRLDVIGGGPLLEGYRAQARALGLETQVTFHGERDLRAIAEAMRHCDVFVVPSGYETFGVVYAEALASGVPVIAGRCGGPEDFVDDAVGRLVTPFDVEALARALREVADHLSSFPAERLRRVAQERFSLAAVGARYEEIYRRALG